MTVLLGVSAAEPPTTGHAAVGVLLGDELAAAGLRLNAGLAAAVDMLPGDELDAAVGLLLDGEWVGRG